ncbi:hypothetical protein FOZ60_007669 [Perkinsus olseni]|uniref:Uncharacterized protein n=1 Tax=Perkinsus olseni TaxID=32597 RepID=A0A7J6NL20_PEROL|nr:hypothetical protein FOZ60_007669 [Perkinsus olseni]
MSLPNNAAGSLQAVSIKGTDASGIPKFDSNPGRKPAVGITLVGLAKAEYKYYCEFTEAVLAQRCHPEDGALTHPDHPNEVRYVSDVCHIKDIPTNSASGSLHVMSHPEFAECPTHARECGPQSATVSRQATFANITEELSPDGPRTRFGFQMRTDGGMLKDLTVAKTVDHVMKLETTSGHDDGDAPVCDPLWYGVYLKPGETQGGGGAPDTHTVETEFLRYFPSTRYPRRHRQAQSLGESDEVNGDTGVLYGSAEEKS